MSLARDDTGYLNALNALETKFVQTRTIEKKENTSEQSGKSENMPEINDVYEKDPSNSKKENVKELEKIQEDYNNLEIQNKDLNEIAANLEQIGKIINEENNKEEKVEEEKEDTETADKKEEARGRIQELMAEVREKQAQIAQMQQEIQNTVNSIVELNIGDNAESIEAEPIDAEKLKQSAIKDIRDNPETVKKIQIKNLDRNLLLAMLTLRQ